METRDLRSTWELYKERDDIELSFTDCSIAILAREHGIKDVLTYDSDFQSLGLQAISNL
jgi:predicted nucleic acid-binding protein